MLPNSLALIGASATRMGLGFLFWLLAAKLFLPSEVGLAAGAVSAMMLCTQLSLLGFGSAVIAEFPAYQAEPGRLLNTAITLVIAVAAVSALLFLLLAMGWLEELSVVGSGIDYALLFIGASVFGTVGILLDQVSTTQRRGHHALARALVFGGSTVVGIALLGGLGDAAGSKAIFLPWIFAGFAACLVGARQLHRSVPRYRVRLAFDLPLTRRLVALGLPNYALTLSERAPGLVLPILVTELLSPAANATWYVVWMMAWVVYIVAIQVGMTLYAEVAREPSAVVRLVRNAIRSSLGVGGAAALIVAIFAGVFLDLLGGTYAAAGATPLRILVFAIVPLTFVQAYFSTCRALRRLGEAIAAGWLSGAVGVAAAMLAGTRYGLDGMAFAWLATQCLSGIWAAWRLGRIGARGTDTYGGDASPSPPPGLGPLSVDNPISPLPQRLGGPDPVRPGR